MKYYNVYYYCNIISNIVMYFQEEYLVNLSEFFELFYPEGLPEKFEKKSVLHSFCEWCVISVLDNDMSEEYDSFLKFVETHGLNFAIECGKNRGSRWFSIERAMDEYEMDPLLFVDFLSGNESNSNEIIASFDEFYDELNICGIKEEIAEKIARECFFILFLNRDFLLHFNYWVSVCRREQKTRVSIPMWVKNAVKFRERGHCALCNRDLSGNQFSINEPYLEQYDHMVPLDSYGLNDVSNIQLLCSECNRKKHSRVESKTIYQDWYEMED